MKKIWIFFVICLFLSACAVPVSTPGTDVLGEEISGNDGTERDPLLEDILELFKPEKELSEEEKQRIETFEELKKRGGDRHVLEDTIWSRAEGPGRARRIYFSLYGTYEHYIHGETIARQDFGDCAYYSESEDAYYISEKGELIDTGKIIYIDDYYLVMDFLNTCYAFKIHYDHFIDFPHEIVNESAEAYVGIYRYTKPRLCIAGYGEGTISVFQYAFDAEETAKTEVWELNLSEDCEIKSVVYSVASDTAEITILEKSDYESDSSKYADGFFDFNADGEVSSIVFYEEVWPSEEEKHRHDMTEALIKYGSDESFLDGTKWERNEGQDFGRSLYLDKWGMYKHSVHGETIDREYFGDMAYYSASDNAYYVVDKQKELMDVGKILYADDYYLVMKFLDACYAFYADKDYDVDFPHGIVPESAKKYVGIYQYTKPHLRIVEYGEGIVSVFQCTYGSDEADETKVWELNLAKDCEFKSVVYSVSSETAKETILEKSDYESDSSKYADGFFDFNVDGEVCSVVFYSEVD